MILLYAAKVLIIYCFLMFFGLLDAQSYKFSELSQRLNGNNFFLNYNKVFQLIINPQKAVLSCFKLNQQVIINNAVCSYPLVDYNLSFKHIEYHISPTIGKC